MSEQHRDTRTETDGFGPIEVPNGAFWGAQTQRSLENFRIGDERFGRVFIRAYGIVKLAAATVNLDHDKLPEDVGRAIILAAREVADGQWDDHFPLVVWQTGSGTQTNMNVNEVIAHRAEQILGAAPQRRIHPNDHVNRSQSTNDTFPSAMHIAAALSVRERLLPELSALEGVLRRKADAYRDVVKLGRTHLQDATPLSLGQEISGWVAQLQQAARALSSALDPVYELAIGGTAVGTGLNSFTGYAEEVAELIAKETGLPFVTAKNKFAALASHDALVGLSGATKQAACALMKVANDVRWLSSGPRAGIGEISIPANEPGSSIMPGKVNPTQCEALAMVCCQVFGNDAAIGFAGSQGNFELNVYKPLMIASLLQSIRLLADATQSFNVHCAEGIEPRLDRIEAHLHSSLMLVTALAPAIGYVRAAAIAKKAHDEGKTLRQVVEELGSPTLEDFDHIVDPTKMLSPAD